MRLVVCLALVLVWVGQAHGRHIRGIDDHPRKLGHEVCVTLGEHAMSAGWMRNHGIEKERMYGLAMAKLHKESADQTLAYLEGMLLAIGQMIEEIYDPKNEMRIPPSFKWQYHNLCVDVLAEHDRIKGAGAYGHK